jgi:hypothetical protein
MIGNKAQFSYGAGERKQETRLQLAPIFSSPYRKQKEKVAHRAAFSFWLILIKRSKIEVKLKKRSTHLTV